MWERNAETEGLLDEFVQHQRAVAGLGDGTLANYRSSVRGFVQWCRRNGGVRLEDVEPADVEAWLIARAEGGAKPHTREGLLYALRAFYRWLRPEVANPAEQVRRPRYAPPVVDPYRVEEAAAILGVAAEAVTVGGRFDHAVLATLRWTGMRVGELTGLRRDDLDLGRRRAKVVGKGSKPRLVPVPVELAAVLADYIDEVRPGCPASALVFANPRARRGGRQEGKTQPQSVRAVCTRGGAVAGVVGPHHPHRWRHTYATELLRGGVDLHVLQRLLGHDKLETATRYLHLLDTDLRAAIDRAFPDDAPPPPVVPRRQSRRQRPSPGQLTLL